MGFWKIKLKGSVPKEMESISLGQLYFNKSTLIENQNVTWWSGASSNVQNGEKMAFGLIYSGTYVGT